ncbi:MAG TPA: alpha/beta-hydrolase family protein [Myxococcaceae bacterium]|nr:alpha/beta-hydrolase family protein [Myxococcaceae bacterium]
MATRPNVGGVSTPPRGVPSSVIQRADIAPLSKPPAAERPTAASVDVAPARAGSASVSPRSFTPLPEPGSMGITGKVSDGQPLSTYMAPVRVDARAPDLAVVDPSGRMAFSTAGDLPTSGLQFLGGAPSRSEIAELFPDKGPAQQPVRIYVGMQHAQAALSPRARARFALSQMKGSGAFSRGRVILAAPSGSGLVNELPVRSAEYLSLGDVATVSLQYAEDPSLLAMGKIGEGAQAYGELLKLIGGELKSMKAKGQSLPEIHLYGESLGARVLQEAMLDHGVEALEAMNVKGALLMDEPTSETAEGLMEAAPEKFGQFSSVKQISKALDAEQLKYVFLTSNESLPKRLGLDLIWSKPKKWPKGKAFLFLFTFLYLIGMMPGGKPDRSELDSYKQEEREDLPEFVNRTFGFGSLKSDVKKVLERLKKKKKSPEALLADETEMLPPVGSAAA